MVVTTDICRAAIVEWLKEKAPEEEWKKAGEGRYLTESNWKRRTKTVTPGGETSRTFTCGGTTNVLASIEVVETSTGRLIVRVDSATQPPEFIHMIAIKKAAIEKAAEEPVDRGPEFGSW